MIPAAVSSDKTGWYDLGILKEFAAKTGHDATGRKLKDNKLTTQEATSHEPSQSVAVTFSPPAGPATIAPQDQVAHAIGGVGNHVG